jgi:hypothetical protein
MVPQRILRDLRPEPKRKLQRMLKQGRTEPEQKCRPEPTEYRQSEANGK